MQQHQQWQKRPQPATRKPLQKPSNLRFGFCFQGRGSIMRLLLRDLLPTLIFLALIEQILADPRNLVFNGNFEAEYIIFEQIAATEFDVTTNFVMTYIPGMRVLHGGVQLLDGFTYHKAIPFAQLYSMFLLHMNYGKGPGVLQTDALSTPRRGALYIVRFLMADHPDGGPLIKAVKVRNIVNNRAWGKAQTFNVSSPYNSRTSLEWHAKSYSFVGTGAQTKLQFESLTHGPYGALIDNVTVTLQSLVENGSFENVSSLVSVSNLTHITVIESPSSEIYGWKVKAGKIKYSDTYRWEFSTDGSPHFVDLNADYSAGIISSDPFETRPRKKHKVLFDTAANPDNIFPPLMGHILAKVYSYPGGALLASKYVVVSAKGFSDMTLGWITYQLEFEPKESWSFVEFESRITGAFNGPLLDNVDVFEVSKPGRYRPLKPSFTGQTVGIGGAPSPTKPPLWTTSLVCVLGHLVSEILLFHR